MPHSHYTDNDDDLLSATLPLPHDVPIRALNRSEYAALEREFVHYQGRWTYHSKALDVIAGLIARRRLTSAIELGPLWRSCVVNADVMDIRDVVRLDPSARLYHHNAANLPWPVEVAYDLFVGLQVFEHLDADFATGRRIPHLRNIQRLVFSEVRRIARHAVISLPIGWQMQDDRDCHHNLSEDIVSEWFDCVPTQRLVGNRGPRKRVIYVFEDISS